MVGNFRADSGNGAVYVFNRDAASGWKMETKISPPGPVTGRNSGFGSSLILRGDTALIGASTTAAPAPCGCSRVTRQAAAGIP